MIVAMDLVSVSDRPNMAKASGSAPGSRSMGMHVPERDRDGSMGMHGAIGDCMSM